MKKLYEIDFRKKKPGTDWSDKRTMQIPASNRDNALVQLGIGLHEDTEVDVIEVRPANAAAMLAEREATRGGGIK